MRIYKEKIIIIGIGRGPIRIREENGVRWRERDEEAARENKRLWREEALKGGIETKRSEFVIETKKCRQ